jgi:hypothetical protein
LELTMRISRFDAVGRHQIHECRLIGISYFRDCGQWAATGK